MDDDAESIITNQRYAYINGVVDKAVKKKARVEHLTISDKVDQIVTNRVLALPIFAVIMYLMYSLSVGTSIADGGWAIGTFATDWTNDVLFGEVVPNALGGFLESIGVAGWLYGLIMDGSCSSCCPSWRTSAICPVSPSSWTVSSVSSACPVRASFPCWSALAAASRASWLPVPSRTSATAV